VARQLRPAFFLLQSLRRWQNPLVSITRRQFEQMQERLGGASPRAVSPAFAPALRAAPNAHRVILGVDPSLRGTGFGVIKLAKPFPETLTHGTISCPAGWERSRCLVKISQTLREAIQKHRPTVCVIEGLFYAQNLQTALIMGEARGAALAAIAEAGLEIFEIAPRKVKQAIVGYGAAHKLAVQFETKLIIPSHFGDIGISGALKTFLKEAGEEGAERRVDCGGRRRGRLGCRRCRHRIDCCQIGQG